jgi:hypothetical protein
LGRAASEGVVVEAHDDPKVGGEEREATRLGAATTRKAEEGRREGRVALASRPRMGVYLGKR